MKDFRGTVIAQAVKQLESANPFIWLIELEVPTDPPTRFRITNYNESVSYGVSSFGVPLVYTPFPVAHGDFSEQKSGSLSEMTINVANVSLEMMTQVELYSGLVDQAVRIRMVNQASLNDQGAQMQLVGKITRTRVRDDVMVFTIGTTNLSKTLFPKNRILAHDCMYRFGGPECQYVIPASPTNIVGGGFSSCGRTFEDCTQRGDDEVARGLTRLHPLRFDGCPGVKGAVAG